MTKTGTKQSETSFHISIYEINIAQIKFVAWKMSESDVGVNFERITSHYALISCLGKEKVKGLANVGIGLQIVNWQSVSNTK